MCRRRTQEEEVEEQDSPLLSGSYMDLGNESNAYTFGSHQASRLLQSHEDAGIHIPRSRTRRLSSSCLAFEYLSHSMIQHEIEMDDQEYAKQREMEFQKILAEEQRIKKEEEIIARTKEIDRLQREKDLEGGMCGYERNCPFGDHISIWDCITDENGIMRPRTKSEAEAWEALLAKEAAEQKQKEKEHTERLAREAEYVEGMERVSRARIAQQVQEAVGESVCACAKCKCIDTAKICRSDYENTEAYSTTFGEAAPQCSGGSHAPPYHSYQSKEKEGILPVKVSDTGPAPKQRRASAPPLPNAANRVPGMKIGSLVTFFENKEKEKKMEKQDGNRKI